VILECVQLELLVHPNLLGAGKNYSNLSV